MIQTIRIQNFRSLQDVTLNLQDVNLLIGPNNSGKSNLLKAYKFLVGLLNDKIPNQEQHLKNYFFLKKMIGEYSSLSTPIVYTLTSDSDTDESKIVVHKIEFFGLAKFKGEFAVRQFAGKINKNETIESLDINISDIESLKNFFEVFFIHYNSASFFEKEISKIANKEISKSDNIIIEYMKKNGEVQFNSYGSYKRFIDEHLIYTGIGEYRQVWSSIKIYSVDISNLKKPYPTLESDYSVEADASNLVAFLDNMRDNKPDIMDAINTSLNECIKEFKTISFEKVALPKDHDLRKIHGDKTFKRLGVQDIYGQIYWADELSDGTLYFLALLAIIHQPDPPKLLMVEEPENGIHPRRIKELIDYFFEIAEKQGVQVILTTHSTVVIDQFTDLPESVFVFDKKDQATTIKNLKTDIIAEDEKQSEKLNVPKLDLSQSLGDHWASGLIGGVPR